MLSTFDLIANGMGKEEEFAQHYFSFHKNRFCEEPPLGSLLLNISLIKCGLSNYYNIFLIHSITLNEILNVSSCLEVNNRKVKKRKIKTKLLMKNMELR